MIRLIRPWHDSSFLHLSQQLSSPTIESALGIGYTYMQDPRQARDFHVQVSVARNTHGFVYEHGTRVYIGSFPLQPLKGQGKPFCPKLALFLTLQMTHKKIKILLHAVAKSNELSDQEKTIGKQISGNIEYRTQANIIEFSLCLLPVPLLGTAAKDTGQRVPKGQASAMCMRRHESWLLCCGPIQKNAT
ncbi:hypothetical protein BDZ97DRAFT_1363963 [Flammula alnicola]|nr:hypothetical protein BDZ97DRAFT_1363963 [Flammula alnicola]